MVVPFQCLYYCPLRDSNSPNVLLAASGPQIFSFDVSDGSLLFTWSSTADEEGTRNLLQNELRTLSNGGKNYVKEASASQDNDTKRPGKRRKLSPHESGSETVSTEIIIQDRNEESDIAASTPAVIKLTGSSNGRYAVAVTGEDKCIRVFELCGNGTLVESSKRYMPKRPCAVVLTTDDSTILCADKFGDVYSLPLLGRSSEKGPQTPSADSTVNDGDVKTSHKAFVPSASTLTVHTRRNHQALQNQQKVTNQPKTKRPLEFDHQLVLGHVSILTDLAYVTLSAPEFPLGKKRSYILTSDRDEHIRVSRGLPQAHIVEGYCLCHTEFVSKLCVPHWQPQLLVSGGGDDYLVLWDWISGTVRLRVDLKGHFDELWKSHTMNISNGQNTISDSVLARIAVSGIWSIRHPETPVNSVQGEIIIACEGIPALLFYSLHSQGGLTFRQCLPVVGNVLDVAVLESRCTILYSMDNIHEKWSTKVLDQGPLRASFGAVTFSASAQSWSQSADCEDAISVMNKEAWARDEVLQEGGGKETALSELLYSIENLRKRGLGQDN